MESCGYPSVEKSRWRAPKGITIGDLGVSYPIGYKTSHARISTPSAFPGIVQRAVSRNHVA